MAPAIYFCGHLTYLRPCNVPGIQQVGVVHSPDSDNLTRWKNHRDYWQPVISVSKEAKAMCDQLDADHSVSVIPNGVTLPSQLSSKTQDGPIEIIWCGRLEDQQKRASDLVPLVNRLLSLNINFHLQIIGEGSLREKLRSNFSVAGDRVTLTGSISRTKVWEAMDAADVILMTSEYEGTPMALLEAMGRGCIPIVYSGVGEPLDFILKLDKQLVVEISDTKSMAQVIHKLVNEKSTRRNLQEQVFQSMKSSEYTDEIMAARYIEAIEQTSRRP
ncbi:hypothetical protein GCM10007047_08800 [Cerasicoccus arenae]|uniref:Glycosyl transferase family 1 domain-containing protein n=1 Tax=Cerasicoccus arenae TaxID=424488 RepID=A0A8J3DFY3_9BACT|nr:hypothetical protein GCM10007047_08800 [Cerasicoccus arenae]